MIKIGVYGSNGRMGREIIDAIEHNEGCVLSYSYSRSEGSDIDDLCKNSDVVIDFSSPEGLMALLPCALRYNTKLVVGTTSFTNLEYNALVAASKNIPILYSANMSFLVALIEKTVSEIARTLDSTYDVEIIDSHHSSKKDAPSGTALSLGYAIAKARNVEFIQWNHQNGKRPQSAIGFSSIRGGNISGEHRIMFIGNNESIEISHKSENRSIYANGAIRCALWMSSQEKPGLYSTRDVYY